MVAPRRYWNLLAPYRGRYLLGLLLLLLTNLLSLLVPWLVKGGVDALAHIQKIAHDAPPPRLGGLLEHPLSYAVALAIVGVGLALIRTTSRIVILGGARQLSRDLKERLYRCLLAADPSFYGRFPTGEIMSRAASDIQVVQAVAAPGVLYTFNALFMFGIAVPYMFSVSGDLTLLLLIPFPFLAGLTMWAASRVKAYAREAQAAMAELTTHLQETLEGMQVVKAFTLEEHQAGRFAESNDRYLERSMKEAMAQGGIGVAATLTGGFGTCVLLFVGGGRVARGELTYGDLALFLAVLAMVLRPTIYLGWVLSLAQRGLASLDRIEEMFDAPLEVEPPLEAEASGPVEGAIDVAGLSFRYPLQLPGEAERRLAVEDVSLSVPAGGTLGLVGRIGSGKSTVLRAIPRFIATAPGAVKVDGVPVESWDLTDLRGGIGYVPQDGMVFSMSLGQNVAFGKPGASAEEVLDAVRLAALEKDLDQLEDGLETLVGERGVTLSGGQRQRLAIARALLIRPQILLLDDALSMVDAETAVDVLKNLRQALPGVTLLIAAHRTATLLGCDELLVLERGRVVERGSPQELLGREGSAFGGMHERQRLQTEIEEAQ